MQTVRAYLNRKDLLALVDHYTREANMFDRTGLATMAENARKHSAVFEKLYNDLMEEHHARASAS